MANYTTLKSAIQTAIKQNGNNEITGNLLQAQLLSMVNSLGEGYLFMGVATPNTDPGLPDQNVFYVANQPGEYTHFGGTTITLPTATLGVFRYNGAWNVDVLEIAKPALDVASDVMRINDAELLPGFSETSFWINGRSLTATGGESWDNNYAETVFLFIPELLRGKTLTINLPTISGAACVWYNDAKEFLSSFHVNKTYSEGENITVPNNASWVRLSRNKIFDNLYTPTFSYKSPEKLNDSELIRNSILDLDNAVPVQVTLSGLINALLLPDGGIAPQTRESYVASETYYPVRPGMIFNTNAYGSGSARGICYYDENKSFVSAEVGNYNGAEYVVPSGVSYVRIGTEFNTTYPLALGYGSLDQKGIPELNDSFEGLEDEILAVKNSVDLQYNDFSGRQNALLDATNGGLMIFSDYPNYFVAVPYYAIRPGTKFYTNAYGSGSARGICYYDENKNFVSAEVGNYYGAEYVVPSGVSYMRICTEYNAAYPLTLTIYAVNNNAELQTPYFNDNRGEWLDQEVAKEFIPKTTKIDLSYKGEVTFQRRFVAIGFDDFRETDFSLIVPLLNKYGCRAVFNQVRTLVDADVKKVNNVIYGGHELGDHTWLHYKFPFDEPLFNGQDPASPEGSQVPFPSNAQMRNNRGDGKNVFGIDLTTPVSTTISYQGPGINTAWGNLSDAECQTIRNWFSVMKDTSTNLIQTLDNLSNRYLGTTGSSNGSWNSAQGCYTGGIFTGCKTSANHEIWERILLVTFIYMRETYGLNYKMVTWSLPGSKSSGCYFENSGKKYYDSSFTKFANNLARFQSSLYKNQDGTYKNRSWTEVLREFGYLTTHDANYPGRIDGQSLPVMREQFILNARQSRPDALIYPTTRSIYYVTLANEYTRGVDLTGTKPLEVQMYESNGTLKTAVEAWRHATAQGRIPGEVIDSEDTWSERMILEGLCRFCQKAGIEMITKAEAYDICFNHPVICGNLIGNPDFRNSVKDFVPTANNLPTNPDGYSENCNVVKESGIPVLVTSGVVNYVQYGVPYGTVKFIGDFKGSGEINFYAITNSMAIDVATNPQSGTSVGSITVDSASAYAHKEIELTIADRDLTTFEQKCEFYGNKIVALGIRYSAGLNVKNIGLYKV